MPIKMISDATKELERLRLLCVQQEEELKNIQSEKQLLIQKEQELKQLEEQLKNKIEKKKSNKVGRPKSTVPIEERKQFRNKQQQEYNKANPDKYKETWVKTTEKNKDKIKERARLYYHRKRLEQGLQTRVYKKTEEKMCSGSKDTGFGVNCNLTLEEYVDWELNR